MPSPGTKGDMSRPAAETPASMGQWHELLSPPPKVVCSCGPTLSRDFPNSTSSHFYFPSAEPTAAASYQALLFRKQKLALVEFRGKGKPRLTAGRDSRQQIVVPRMPAYPEAALTRGSACQARWHRSHRWSNCSKCSRVSCSEPTWRSASTWT